MFMTELKEKTEYKLQELVRFLIEQPESLDEFCLYTKKDHQESTNDLICYIDSYPEVNESDEEIYSEFVINKSLHYFISGEQLADVVDNTLHQKQNANINDILKNIDYYLERDTFFDFI